MNRKYKVGGYVKLAKLWERSKDAAVAYHSSYYAERFRDDVDTPHDIEYCMTNARTQLYRAQVAKLKERYAGKLDILCGLEWDLYSDDDPAAYDYWR